VRCTRCGNENPEQNRFCGMCGGSLLSASASQPAEPQPVSVVAASEVVAEPAPDSPRSAVENRSAISGPSFLGLNEPAPSKPAARKRARLSIDPHSAPGSNLDYLLDEEEPAHHWGIGKILLIFIALALAAGFGYLRFKNQGLAWLNGLRKPAAVAQNSTAPETTTAPPSSPSVTPDSQPVLQPTTAAPPQPTTAAPANPPSGREAATPAPATSAAGTPAPSDTPKPDVPAAASADKAAEPTDKDSSAAKDASSDTAAPATKPAENPKPAPRVAGPKPSPARLAAPYDPVAAAQKYLYGRGAPQDCDRGLRLLRPAANQSNPKAMIEMGALYSAGLCAPHDLPTAYRWFALALRKDPDNLAVQNDLQKLWGEMTQPERQLAIKLSQ